MSECSHEKQYCWCEADSWAFREAEPLRKALAEWKAYAEWLEAVLASDENPPYVPRPESRVSVASRTTRPLEEVESRSEHDGA